MVNQSDKQRKMGIESDIAIPTDSNIRKKDHDKLEKYQVVREELEKMWKVKVRVVPVVIRVLRAVTPTLAELLQQISGTTAFSVQKSKHSPGNSNDTGYSSSQDSGRVEFEG